MAAVFDVRSRRIPNWLNAFGVLAGLLLNSFLDVDKYNWRSALMGLGTGVSRFTSRCTYCGEWEPAM